MNGVVSAALKHAISNACSMTALSVSGSGALISASVVALTGFVTEKDSRFSECVKATFWKTSICPGRLRVDLFVSIDRSLDLIVTFHNLCSLFGHELVHG